ncbi:branched-chain amino acid ABC transporter permease [Paenibacillus rhizoplanae]
MEYFIQQLINGISVGSIYALIALGYTMVYGIIKLINFAHGDVFMVGSFIGLYSAKYLANAGMPPIVVLLLSLIISMTISALLGITIERLAYKPLRKSTRIAALITAIGVSFLLEYTGVLILGPQAKGFPDIMDKKQYHLFGSSIQVESNQIMILLTTIILMLVLQYIVRYTKTGKSYAGRFLRCRSGAADGHQCRPHHFSHLRHRFGACRCSGRDFRHDVQFG